MQGAACSSHQREQAESACMHHVRKHMFGSTIPSPGRSSFLLALFGVHTCKVLHSVHAKESKQKARTTRRWNVGPKHMHTHVSCMHARMYVHAHTYINYTYKCTHSHTLTQMRIQTQTHTYTYLARVATLGLLSALPHRTLHDQGGGAA
jgi:hypothetical protein